MRLSSKVRTNINNGLYDLSKTRHPSIPLDKIQQLLDADGWKIEDCILTGRQGNANIEIIKDNNECSNSYLVLSWMKGDNDNQWEINAYLS